MLPAGAAPSAVGEDVAGLAGPGREAASDPLVQLKPTLPDPYQGGKGVGARGMLKA